MQFKEVKEVQAVEEKSAQEIEKELLEKHEQQFNLRLLIVGTVADGACGVNFLGGGGGGGLLPRRTANRTLEKH